MGAYRYTLCGPSAIFLGEVDSETVPIACARYAFKPFWSDESYNRKLWNESIGPASRAWKRRGAPARPRFYALTGDTFFASAGKPREGDEVRTLPASFRGVSWLDEPDGHIGRLVGYLHKHRVAGTNRWVVRKARKDGSDPGPLA